MINSTDEELTKSHQCSAGLLLRSRCGNTHPQTARAALTAYANALQLQPTLIPFYVFKYPGPVMGKKNKCLGSGIFTWYVRILIDSMAPCSTNKEALLPLT